MWWSTTFLETGAVLSTPLWLFVHWSALHLEVLSQWLTVSIGTQFALRIGYHISCCRAITHVLLSTVLILIQFFCGKILRRIWGSITEDASKGSDFPHPAEFSLDLPASIERLHQN